MKLNRNAWMLLMVLQLGLLGKPASESGVVEGLVRDKLTGRALEGVTVQLFTLTSQDPLKVKSIYGGTDKEGRFSFKELTAGQYFLDYEFDGYVSAPLRKYVGTLWFPTLNLHAENFHSPKALLKALGVFSLDRGGAKKLTIDLERAGALKGILRLESCSGKLVPGKWTMRLFRHSDPDDSFLKECDLELNQYSSDENGRFEVENLIPGGRYFFVVYPQGYIETRIDAIPVKAGQTGFMDARFRTSREPSPSSVINSVALSGDGNWLAWGGPFCLYLAKMDEFPRYREYPLDRMEFATENLSFSGDGKVLYGLGRGALYRGSVQSGSFQVESCWVRGGMWHYLNVNGDGSRVAVSQDGPQTPVANPAWRVGTELEYRQDRFTVSRFLTQPQLKFYLESLFRDSSDNLYFTQNGDPEPLLYRMEPAGEKKILWQVPKEMHILDVSPEGDLVLVTGAVSQKDKAGNPIWTLFIARRIGETLGKPEPILLPGETSIEWNARFMPDGQGVVWLQLLRGADGREIEGHEVRLCRRQQNGWGPQETLFVLPKHVKNCSFRISRRNLVVVSDENEILVYPKLAPGTKPVSKKIAIKPRIIFLI